MVEFLWFIGILFAIYVIVKAWPLFLLLATGMIIYFAYKIYKDGQAAEEARMRNQRRIEQEKKEEERRKIEASIKAYIKDKFDSVNILSIRNATEYLKKLDTSSRQYAVYEFKKHEDAINELLHNKLCEKHIKEASVIADFLLLLELGNSEYRIVSDTIKSMIDILSQKTVFLQYVSYGIYDESQIDKIKKDFPYNKTDITKVDIRQVLWAYAMTEPFDRYGYKAVADNFIGKEYNGHNQIDFIGTLIYLESKHGDNLLESIIPDYKNYLFKEINSKDYVFTKDIMSIAAWCSNKKIEKELLSQLEEDNANVGVISERRTTTFIW